MAVGFQVGLDELITASMRFNTLREKANTVANGLANELGDSAGMAGDDGGGNAFATVYEPAAQETVNKIAFTAYVMGETAAALMRMAYDYLASEDAVAAAMMRERPPDQAIDLLKQQANDPCNATGQGNELPHVVDEQGWLEKGLRRGSAKGNTGKLGDAGGSWEHAAVLLDDLISLAQGEVGRIQAVWQGQAMEEFDRYFALFVGYQPAPAEPTECATLVANLASSCRRIALACDRYSGYIRAQRKDFDFSFSGNQDDTKKQVLGDEVIRSLGTIPPTLDASRVRIELPKPPGDRPGLPNLPPLIPVPLPAPVGAPIPVALASTTSRPSITSLLNSPAMAPPRPGPPDPSLVTPPLPPPPGAVLLTPQERAQFVAWQGGLHTHTFANNRNQHDPPNAYQMRTAGYPEYDLPLGDGGIIQADGLRPDDGTIMEAKYVQNAQNTCRVEATLNDADATLGRPWVESILRQDVKEMAGYTQAMKDSGGNLRQVEIHTNYAPSVAYWNLLMLQQHTTGSAIYTP